MRALVCRAGRGAEGGKELAAEAGLMVRQVGGEGRACSKHLRVNQNLQAPGVGIDPNDVSIPNPGDRAAVNGFRRDVNGGGTLPEAPDMRPSVTSATRRPRS